MTNPYCLLMAAKKLDEIKTKASSNKLNQNKDNLKTINTPNSQSNKTTTKEKQGR